MILLFQMNLYYKRAAQKFSEAGRSGSYQALNSLARCFQEGKGVKKTWENRFRAAMGAS